MAKGSAIGDASPVDIRTIQAAWFSQNDEQLDIHAGVCRLRYFKMSIFLWGLPFLFLSISTRLDVFMARQCFDRAIVPVQKLRDSQLLPYMLKAVFARKIASVQV